VDHVNGAHDGHAGRQWPGRMLAASPWWERHGYRVVRALVLLCIAGLASLAYFTSRGSGQAPPLGVSAPRAVTPTPVRAGVRIATVDPYSEIVYVVSFEQQAVDLTGWRIVAANRERPLVYYFPPGVRIAPGGVLRVHTYRGTDTETDLYWGLPDDSDVWAWRGGIALLYDAEGREASRFTYAHGSSTLIIPSPSPSSAPRSVQ
jgi:hypothetical protein